MRTTGITLEAETGKYKAEMADSAKVTRGLKDDVEGLGHSSERTGRAVDDLGGDFRDTARDAKALDREISAVQRSLAGLAVEFAATGKAADRLDLSKGIRKQQTELRQLLKVQKLLPTPNEAEPAARSFGKVLMSGIGTGLQSAAAGSPGITAGAIIGAALAPSIAAGIGAAFSAGIGFAAIGGGIALLAKSPEVADTGKAIGKSFLAGITAEAVTFRRPVLDALDDVSLAADRAVPKIGKIFSNSAPSVEALTGSIVRLSDRLLDSFVVASANSGSSLKSLGRLLEGVGGAVGDMITTLSKDSAAGSSAIDDLTNSLVNFVHSTTMFLDGLADIKGGLDGVDKWIDSRRSWLEDHSFALDLTADGYKKNSEAAELYRKGLIGAKGSVDDYNAYLQKQIDEQRQVKDTADGMSEAAQLYSGLLRSNAIPSTDDLTAAQKLLKDAQSELGSSLDGLGGKMSRAEQLSNGLKSAMDNLYGSAIRQTEANEGYEASFDNLSSAVKGNASQVKKNANNLDIHTAAGRSNRDVLEDLLGKSNELYLADIAAGDSIAQATKKHQARTAAVKEEARRVGLNKQATDDLIGTYGQIPKKKTTDLVVAGVNKIVDALRDIYVFQRALADGIPVASEIAKLKGEKGPAKKYGGYAQGGTYSGKLPGPPSSVDNLRGHGPNGDGFGLAGGEWIINAKQSAKHHHTLKAINEGTDGFADGGYYPGTVDTSRRWPFEVDARNSRVMSKAQAATKVTPGGPSGTGPTEQFIINAVHRAFPGMRAISTFRAGARTLSGNPSYHGVHRAVDWPASRPLAEFWNANYKARTKEFISPWNDLNIHNGQRHTYTGAIYRQHNFAGGNAHDHIAMANGGVINEPVYGYGASGRSYSFGERGAETVTPGTPQWQAPPVVVNVHQVAPPAAAPRGPLVGTVLVQERNDVDVLVNRIEFLTGGL